MNIGSWFQTWLNVTTRPGEPVFEEERAKPQANLTTAAIWVGLVALVAGIFSLIQGAIAVRQLQAVGGLQGILGQLDLPAEVMGPAMDQLNQLPAGFIPGVGRPGVGLTALFGGIFGAIISFIIFAGLLQLVAKILGGTGSFSKYTYLLAAVYVPVTLVSSVLGIVPLLGGCVTFIVWIYQLVLAYYATRVEHKLSSGRSIIVVLAPLIILLIVGCCFISTIGGILGAVIGSGR
jgi:hypothetical protein